MGEDQSPSQLRQVDEACVRWFTALVGDLGARAITRSHVAAFLDALETRMGLSAANVAAHLDKVLVLFVTAVSEDLLAFSPAHTVRARNRGTKPASKRQDFTPEQVHRIFEEVNGERSDFGCLVRLLAFHGMRSGEACQLRCDDIITLNGTASKTRYSAQPGPNGEPDLTLRRVHTKKGHRLE